MLARFDAAVLQAADRAVAWLWTRWGVGRRTVVAMLLLAWIATEISHDIASVGRVSLLNAAIYAALLGVRGLGDQRTPAALTALRRDTPLIRTVRLISWSLALWDAFGSIGPPGALLAAVAAVLFVVYIYATDSLHPKGPPGPKRREKPVVLGANVIFGR